MGKVAFRTLLCQILDCLWCGRNWVKVGRIMIIQNLALNHFFVNMFSFGPTFDNLCQCLCLTNIIWHSTSNPKCHINVTCLVICVISISEVLIDVWFFPYKSHYMSDSKSLVLTDVQFYFVQVFACQLSKTWKNFVKNTHWPLYHLFVYGWRTMDVVFVQISKEHATYSKPKFGTLENLSSTRKTYIQTRRKLFKGINLKQRGYH